MRSENTGRSGRDDIGRAMTEQNQISRLQIGFLSGLSVSDRGRRQRRRQRFFPARGGGSCVVEASSKRRGDLAAAVGNVGQFKGVVRLCKQPRWSADRFDHAPVGDRDRPAAGRAAENPVAAAGPPGGGIPREDLFQTPSGAGVNSGAAGPGNPADQVGDGRPEVGRQREAAEPLRRLPACRIDDDRRHLHQFGKGGRFGLANPDPAVESQRQAADADQQQTEPPPPPLGRRQQSAEQVVEVGKFTGEDLAGRHHPVGVGRRRDNEIGNHGGIVGGRIIGVEAGLAAGLRSIPGFPKMAQMTPEQIGRPAGEDRLDGGDRPAAAAGLSPGGGPPRPARRHDDDLRARRRFQQRFALVGDIGDDGALPAPGRGGNQRAGPTLCSRLKARQPAIAEFSERVGRIGRADQQPVADEPGSRQPTEGRRRHPGCSPGTEHPGGKPIDRDDQPAVGMLCLPGGGGLVHALGPEDSPLGGPLAAGFPAVSPMSASYRTAPTDTARMPPGIPYIVGNEAAERFSFYGMKAILTVFMTEHLLDRGGSLAVMSDADAKFYVHSFVVASYLFPLIGAVLADWLFGKYRTILWLSIIYCLGHLALALDETRLGLGLGLSLIAIGTGAIKPCVSAHVGDQFGAANRHLLSRVFGWFYLAINLGALASTLLTPILLDHDSFTAVFGRLADPLAAVGIRPGPALAFGVPGLLMALATLVFWLGRHSFIHVPPRGERFFQEALSGDGRRALAGLLPIYACVAAFWCLFDQTASAWVLQAKSMNMELFGTTWLPSQLQAVNPLFILLFVPLFSYLVYPAIDRIFPLTPLRKIGLGMFLTVPAFGLSGLIQHWIDGGAAPSVGWQVFAYALLTAAEVMVSITCLEFSYTQSPPSIKSIVMSLYLASIALGNEFTAVVNALISRQPLDRWLAGANYYWFFTAVMLLAAIAFIGVAVRYRGRSFPPQVS